MNKGNLDVQINTSSKINKSDTIAEADVGNENTLGAISFSSSAFKNRTKENAINTGINVRQRSYSRDMVRRFLAQPLANVDKLQELSRHLNVSSGNYFRIVKYLSQIPTMYHMLSPTVHSMDLIDGHDDILLDEYFKAAQEIKRLNIRRNFPWILEQLILMGEVYLYEVDTGDKIGFIQIPNEWCRIASVDNGVYRYDINVLGLNERELEYLPVEFRMALNKKGTTTDGWVRISSKGFAFSVLKDYPKGVPLLSFIFDDIMGLEDMKDLIENKTKVNTITLVHQKIPSNKNNVPVFNTAVARQYHEATKKNLPEGVAINTNPLELSHIPFQESKTPEVDAIERSQRNLWESVGISDLIFSNNKTGGEVMKLSVRADEILIFPFLKMFGDYINSKLSSDHFMFEFLEVSYFNEDKFIENQLRSIEAGGSRLRYLAAMGYEPYQIIPLLSFEQKILNIDNIMLPKEKSHTLSGKSPGRPSNEEAGKPDSDNTEKARERE